MRVWSGYCVCNKDGAVSCEYMAVREVLGRADTLQLLLLYSFKSCTALTLGNYHKY